MDMVIAKEEQEGVKPVDTGQERGGSSSIKNIMLPEVCINLRIECIENIVSAGATLIEWH